MEATLNHIKALKECLRRDVYPNEKPATINNAIAKAYGFKNHLKMMNSIKRGDFKVKQETRMDILKLHKYVQEIKGVPYGNNR